MEKQKPPIRIVIPGKVFRRETPDPTHLPMFFQLEGLVVDEGVTFAHLKGTLGVLPQAALRRRDPDPVPAELLPVHRAVGRGGHRVPGLRGQGSRCRICGGTGWKEILGSGMVDPQVFKNVNIDPEKYSGWAFGMGIDRTAMFAYGISDMRYFFENDLRFIRQFNLK